MGLLDNARSALHDREGDADPPDTSDAVTNARFAGREATVMAGGETVTVDAPDTVQTDEDGNTWLTGSNEYGRPRGTQALENRQIVQTSAMQAIVNGVADQVLGGELTFEGNDDVIESFEDADESITRLRDLIRSVLEGPHLQNISLDDLITAAIEDMMGPGQAYWQLLGASDADIPVVALIELDPLTIRHNVDRHGVPGDPPYWQAQSAFAGGSVAQLGNVDPTPLQDDDVAVMSYPRGHRSYHAYPISPAWQVREWLEILANSTTHHNRFYSDNEIPPGLLQVVGASDNTIKEIKEKLEESSGDPRNAPVVGTEGAAKWLDLGGTSVNLNVIEEQKWFFELCLGALGLGKQELGFIEDVNRSNGEVESTRVYKRVAGPFIAQFEKAFLHIARQFDAFNQLGEPFTPTIDHSDPREERAKEERMRAQLQAGAITPKQYARGIGNDDLAEDPDQWTIELAGEKIDYGEHPMWVTKRLMSAAAGDGVDTDGEPDDMDGEQSLRQDGPFTDYPQAATENAKMALEAREDTGNPNDCGTDTGWARANQLADREALSEDTVRRMAAFRRHQDNAEMDDEEGRADCGWMMWKAWGGEEGVSWAERKVDSWEDD